MDKNSLQKRLEKIFLVCQVEWKPLLWMVLLNCILNAGGILAFSVVNSLFMKRMGFEQLPYAFILCGMVMIPFFTFYNFIERKVNRKIFLIGSFILYGIFIGGFRYLIFRDPDNDTLLLLLFIIATCLLQVIDLQYWSFANLIFHPRQAKRLFSLLGMGGTLGIIGMGFSLRVILKWISSVNLLYLWSGLFFMSAVTVFLMYHFLGMKNDENKSHHMGFRESVKEELNTITRLPLLRIMTGIIFILSLMSFIIYFQFNRVAGGYFPGEDDFTGFIGSFNGILYIVILLYQFFLTGRIVSALGPVKALFLHPLLMFIPILWSIFKPDMLNPVLITRFSDVLSQDTIFQTGSESIYSAVSSRRRVTAMSFIKIIATPLSIGISGFLLMEWVKYFKPGSINIILPFLLLIWIFLIWQLRDLYVETLFDNFTEDEVKIKLESFKALSNMKGTDALGIIRRILNKGTDRMKVFAIELAGEMDIRILRDEVGHFLLRKDRNLRLASIKTLGKIGGDEYYSKIMKIYNEQSPDDRINILETLREMNRQKFNINAPLLLLEEKDPWVLGFLLENIWSRRDLTTEEGMLLKSMIEDPREEFQIASARVLKYDKKGLFQADLLTLMKQESLRVRKEAVISAGISRNQSAIPLLTDIMEKGEEELANDASDSLSLLQEGVFEIIRKGITFKEDYSLLRRKMKILSHSVDKADQMFIIQNSYRIPPQLCALVLGCMAKNITELRIYTKEEEKLILNMIEQKEKEITDSLIGTLSMKDSPHGEVLFPLLATIMKERIVSLQRLTLLGIHFLYPNEKILTLTENIFSGDVRKKHVALEALENILPVEIKKGLIPAFEKDTLEEEMIYLSGMFSATRFTPEETVSMFFRDRDPWLLSWVFFAGGKLRLERFRKIIEEHLQDKDPIISQHARRGFSLLTEGKEREMLSTLEKILFLRQVEIFSEFSARELGIIAQKAQEKGYSRDQVIFRRGEPGDALYIIVGGKVRIVREEGEQQQIIAILEDKECFGEMAILGDETRSATVESADVVTLLKISKKDFHELILKKPEMAFHIFKILIKRIKDATDRYMEKINETKSGEAEGKKGKK